MAAIRHAKASAGLWTLSLVLACQRLDLQEPPGGNPDETDSTPEDGEDGEDDGPGTFECSPVVQDCDPGEKCTPVDDEGSQDHYICVADSGDLERFDRCEPDATAGRDGCSPGLVCLAGSEERGASGICVDLCRVDSDCSTGRCIVHPDTGVPHCGDGCDPLEAQCSAPLQCRRYEDGFVCRFPDDEDIGEAGASCSGQDEGCTEGYACVDGALFPGCNHTGCCSPICDHTDPETTGTCEDAFGSGTQCGPLLESPRPGLEHIGACYIPA